MSANKTVNVYAAATEGQKLHSVFGVSRAGEGTVRKSSRAVTKANP